MTGVGGRPFFTRKVTTVERRDPAARTRTRATPGTSRSKSGVRSRTASSSAARTLRRGQVDHGRHVGSGGVELGQRLRARQPEQRAAGALELRSGPPHHADGDATTFRSAKVDQAGGLGVLLGPVRPSLHADLQRRRERRQPHTATTWSTSRQRPTRSPTRAGRTATCSAVSERRPCLADFIGQIIPRNACRAPWTNTLDGRFAVQLPYKRFKTEVTLDVLNLINLFDATRAAVPVLVEQRDAAAVAGADARSTAGVAAHGLQHRHADLADVRAVPARRPALALADPARRARPVLDVRRPTSSNARSLSRARACSFLADGPFRCAG